MHRMRIFPTILIILNICTALSYVPDCDWRRIVYWLAAAVLTITVTY